MKQPDEPTRIVCALLPCQAKPARKGFGDTEQFERKRTSRSGSGIASQPLLPGQTVMRTLGTRDRGRSSGFGGGKGWLSLDVQALAMQVETCLPLVSPIPVPPQQRSRSHRQGMEQDADLARFACFAPAPLALLPQRTRTAIANAGGIDHPQTAIAFSTPFMRNQDIACGTPKRPIRLKGKVGPGEAASFPRRVAVAGGAYPEAGAEAGGEVGRVGTCSFCGGRAGANSVVRSGSGLS